MTVDAARAKSIFLAASELPDPAQRANYLDQQCGSDGPLEPGSKPCCGPMTLRRNLVTNRPGPAMIPPSSSPAKKTPERSSPVGTNCWKRSAKGAWVGLGGRAIPAGQTQGGPEADQGRHGFKSVLARFEAERQAWP